MTRKQRMNVTYDLSNPRNLAAFEALLEDEDDEGGDVGGPSRPSKATRQQQARKKREKEKFFMLKSDAAAEASQPAGSGGDHIQQLMELFEGNADKSLVTDVYQACGCSVEAAAEALFGMLGGVVPPPPGTAAPSSSAASTSSSYAAAAGSSRVVDTHHHRSGARAAAAAAALQRQQQMQQQHEPGVYALSWSDLPPDVRHTILSQLSPADLARAASTCSEFRDWANAMRAHVRHLVLQPGVSYSCLRGMVSSHVAAGVMDFTRFERHRRQHLNPKEQLTQTAGRSQGRRSHTHVPTQVVAMHKAEAEAALFQGLIAVAEGSGAICRRTSVTGLILKGLVGVTDRVLAEALQNLKGLRSLDISHCPNLTNKSFYLLAKYKATQGGGHMQPIQQRQQQGVRQQQQDEDDTAEDDELMYGWASSSSSSEEEDEEGSSSSSSEAGSDAAADEAMPVGEGSTAAAQQQQQQQEDGGDGVDGVGSSQVAGPSSSSSASTPAAAVARQLAALEIQHALFVTPELGAAAAAAGADDADEAVTAAADVGGGGGGPAAVAAVGGLQELKLSGNECLLDDGLRQVLQHPVIKHSLTKLDISGCRKISSAGLIVPPLGVLCELKACRCPGLREVIIQLPGRHPLATCDLSGCHHLQLVDLGLMGLKGLNLSGCRTLHRLRMRCPSLESLSLAQCGNLYDFHDDAWQVPALQQLNLFGCRRASGAQLQVVLDRLAALKWISLNGCHGINTLHLSRNLELEGVDLSGCRFLSAFSCASPVLKQLTASSCSRLQSLTLSSNMLQVLLLTNCKLLADVHVSAPGPTEAAAAAGDAGERGQQAAGAGGSNGSSRRGARGAGVARVVCDTRGCVSLTALERSRLVAAMAGR